MLWGVVMLRCLPQLLPRRTVLALADGNALTGLAEVVHDEAARVPNLAEEIESRRIRPSDIEPNRSAPRSRNREHPRPRQGRITVAVTRVLRDHRQPLQAREVHARVEMLLDEPVLWASIKATLADNVHGTAPRFVQIAGGRYSIFSHSTQPSAPREGHPTGRAAAQSVTELP